MVYSWALLVELLSRVALFVYCFKVCPDNLLRCSLRMFVAHVLSFCQSNVLQSFAEVEASPHCREVLKCRMAEGLLPSGPIYEDVRGFEPSADIKSKASGLIGGFPCQATCFRGCLQQFVNTKQDALVSKAIQTKELS